MSNHPYNAGLSYASIVGRFPTAPALRLADGVIVSHAQLDGLANRMVRVLSARGVGYRDAVVIFHEKTVECFATMLACLKLGAPYVNLDEQNPPLRLEYIFSSCRPAAIVGPALPPGALELARMNATPVILFSDSELQAELTNAGDAEPSGLHDVSGSDPAYVIYTSGSTGVPKGAVVSHASVLSFCGWATERLEITAADVLSNLNPMYFDNSVFDFYVALLNGASFVPIPRTLLTAPGALLDHLEATHCTTWFSVPSLLMYLSTLKQLTPQRLPRVRTFMFAGESYPIPELRKFFAVFGGRSRIINAYGPTEATCLCTAWDVTAADLTDDVQGQVPIGPPAPNVGVIVLDEQQRAVGPGRKGELFIAGPQVALGYINDPARTAASFVRNPLNPRWEERMYRTGDVVSVGADGQCMTFLGRKDNQVKHMGYRIELEEIEAAINSLEGVRQSAVLHLDDGSDMKILVAHIATEGARTKRDVRAHLKTKLPVYMIPQRLILRSTLPRNPNGKVDRAALTAEHAAEAIGIMAGP